MEEQILSFRLPGFLINLLRASAANSRRSVPQAVDWLLCNSISNSQILRNFADCPDRLTSKLDVRIPIRTLEQLKIASQTLGMSISVYTRTLLYHFYVSKRVFYLKSGDRYTLAIRHD
jgi:hypothetical protein